MFMGVVEGNFFLFFLRSILIIVIIYCYDDDSL